MEPEPFSDILAGDDPIDPGQLWNHNSKDSKTRFIHDPSSIYITSAARPEASSPPTDVHNPQLPFQHLHHKAAASDGGNSSLNDRARVWNLDDSDRPSHYVPAPADARHTPQKRGLGQDPSSVPHARPSKQPLTEKIHQARNLSRQNSTSEAPSRTTSPQTWRVTSPTVQSPLRDASSNVHPYKSPRPDQSPSTNSALSEPDLVLLKQPPTRPISELQLINEVKGIYAGLVMVEKKCVEIVTSQAASTKSLEPQQWKALVALHRTLLQEHHDFFSASQHPTASDALKKLALKYAMPARMWRHGIHAFLELLRHRLPDSIEHMLSFIYVAYGMMALLKESVPSFLETWIECLGDLARYRMAIEDSDPRDREIWSNVARTWYNEAADKSPNVGRIQHHLAVLARPYIVEQLFYYTKALTTLVPFVNARESIMLLFDMCLKSDEVVQARYPQLEAAFVHGFALLFTRGSTQEFLARMDQVSTKLAAHMDRSGPKLKVQGPQMALSLVSGLLDFGKDDSPVWKCARAQVDLISNMRPKSEPQGTYTVADDANIKKRVQAQAVASLHGHAVDGLSLRLAGGPHEGDIRSSSQAIALTGQLFWIVTSVMASRIGDKNVVSYMHCALANLYGMTFMEGALDLIECFVPWSKVATFLNTVGRSGISYSNVEAEPFPPSFGAFGRQLPEDFFLRGYVSTQCFYPLDFFSDPMVDEDERTVELPSHQAPRTERCLWLGVRFAALKRWITYDFDTKQFGVTELAEGLALN